MIGSYLIVKDKIFTPATACCTMKAHRQPHPRQRRGPHTGSYTSRRRKKQIGHTPPSCGQSSLTKLSLSLVQLGSLPTSFRISLQHLTTPHDPKHRLHTYPLHQFLQQASHLQHPTRTFSLTCPHAITRTLPSIPLLRKRPTAGVDLT